MPEVPYTEHGFGLFGPDFGVPAGGFCASTFLVLERDDQVLVGRMDEAHAGPWIDEWAPNLAYYDGERYDRLFEGLRLPASYLRVGEHPTDAAQRVWRDQLGFGDPLELPEPRIVSGAKASRRAPGAQHWDLLFLYRVEGPAAPVTPGAHWAEIGYRDPADLDPEDLVMLHGELLELL